MPNGAERIVNAQAEAFNRHDAAAMADCYSVDGEFTSAMNGAPTVVGRDSIRDFFAQLFVNVPDMHVTIKHRMRIGTVVVDHEYVDGLGADTVAVYEVQGSHIARAWVFGPLAD